MTIRRPGEWLGAERALDVAPRFAPRVGEPWSKRLNYTPGRTLTHRALETEQRHRDRRFALPGRGLAPGVVTGLEVSGEPLEIDGQPDMRVRVAPGLAVTALGEDLFLPVALNSLLSAVPPAFPLIDGGSPPRGLVVLSLTPARVVRARLHDSEDPCPVDPEAFAYEDIVTADAVRLVWRRLDLTLPVAADPLQLRNLIAYDVFREEAAAIARGVRPDWEGDAVPVALLLIEAGGAVSFLDRFSVTRRGGAPRRASPMAEGGAALWRSRFDQFLEQTRDLRVAGVDLESLSSRFRYLPPVSIVPASFLDFDRMEMPAFPSGYVIEAVPVPVEQLEAVLAESNSLRPYDLETPDYVQLLVPVPESVFEPRLLIKEEIDLKFQQEIDQATKDVEAFLFDRNALWAAAPFVFGLVAPETIPQFKTDLGDPPLPDGDKTPFGTKAIAVLRDLQDEAKTLSVTAADKAALDPALLESQGSAPGFAGLTKLATELQARVDKANDAIDLRFVRLQADIYRIRQNVLGGGDAIRLVTSPVLSNIAEAGSTVDAYNLISSYFSTLRANVPETAGSSGAVTSAATVTRAGSGSVKGGGTIGLPQPVAGGVLATVGEQSKIAKSPADSSVFAFDQGVVAKSLVDSSYVRSQSLLYGRTLPVRTVSVAERLKASASHEARNFAIATKAEIVRELQTLDIFLDDIPLQLSASRMLVVATEVFDPKVKDLATEDQALLNRFATRSGDAVVVDIGGLEEAVAGITDLPRNNALTAFLQALIGAPVTLGYKGLSDLIQNQQLDPQPVDPDDAILISAAVGVLESAIGILRAAEGQLANETRLLELMREALIAAYELAGDWRSDLDDVEADLAEARHDLDLAEALTEEEQERLDQLNAHRRNVLRENVEILALRRPRTVARCNDVPKTAVYGVFEDPVPLCLRQDIEPPDELQELLELFRDAPLAWFTALARLVDRIDRRPRLLDLFSLARRKAQVVSDARRVALASSAPTAPLIRSVGAGGVQTLLASYTATRTQWLTTRANMDLSVLSGLSWRGLRDRALEDLSLNDLIEGGRGRSRVARAGLAELERIEDVAACLYQSLRRTPTQVRLDWAEQMSVFDAPLDLRRLDRLPGWQRIAFEDRRVLLRLNGWLFSRVDAAIPESVSFLSDLVRVCILLASHAPVSALIEGRIAKAANGKTGDTIEVSTVRGEARPGMVVRFGSLGVQGVVEDIIGVTAQVRITRTTGASFSLPGNQSARFLDQGATRFATPGQLPTQFTFRAASGAARAGSPGAAVR